MTHPKRCPTCGKGFEADVAFCPQDGTPTREGATVVLGSDPFVGAVLLGHIRVERLIGVGAMASVYAAHQEGIERKVAVKILSEDAAGDADLRLRLVREARLAASIVHPHVVQMLLVCEATPGGGGEPRPALVMELVDGMSLRAAREGAGGTLPLPRVLHIGAALAEALGEAHALGIVHRDVKPENVMLTKRGEDADFVKVLDFGLARAVAGEMTDATRRGAVFGTPRYLSPEAAVGAPVGAEGDVYAVGAILFELLAGHAPFERPSAVGYLVAHANERAPALRSTAKGYTVPDPIAAVVDACLAKRREDRPADGRALARALRAAMRESGFVDSSAAVVIPPAFASTSPYPSATQVSGASTLATDAPQPSVRVPTLVDDPSPLDLPRAETPAPLPVTPVTVTPTLAESPPRWRGPLLFVASFALGALIVGAVTLSGRPPKVTLSPADALYAEAQEAASARAWDEPPGRNVRDLLARGRASFPADPRFADASRRASLEATADAVRARQSGQTDQAERLARAALSMDPDNGVAQTMLREMTTKDAPPPSSHAKGQRPPPSPTAPRAPGPAPSATTKDGDPPPDGGRWM